MGWRRFWRNTVHTVGARGEASFAQRRRPAIHEYEERSGVNVFRTETMSEPLRFTTGHLPTNSHKDPFFLTGHEKGY
jgi:hypothetical protein